MIGKLTGSIDSFGTNYLILDVQGVGYVVHASSRTLSRIGTQGESASLLIETQVREDAITLFGFFDQEEKSWFRLLTSVQGVGAKVALAILSVSQPDQMAFIIASQDKSSLTRADGVGPKLATRILSELKDKSVELDVMHKGAAGGAHGGHSPVQSEPPDSAAIDSDAVSALVNLGYARADAYMAVANTKQKLKEDSTLQDIIRTALKEMGAP
jgi:Holliday junction DNA helicase RuvA